MSADDIFGGEERMVYMRRELQKLKDEGAQLMLVSHGFTDVVKAAMEKGNMPEFEETFGSDHPKLSMVDCDKTRLTANLIKNFNLKPTECILIDDDPRNLIPARQHQVCPTLFIWSRKGITELELQSLSNNDICSSKQRNYSLCKTLPIPEIATTVADGYYVMSGTLSLESAVSKANSVPSSHRFEPVRIVRTPDEGAHAIYCALEHLSPFREMVLKYTNGAVDLDIPKSPPRPLTFKNSSSTVTELLTSHNESYQCVEVRISGRSCIDRAITEVADKSFQNRGWRVRKMSTSYRSKPSLTFIFCKLQT